jgi:3-isopropylmalate dehydratase small subunit
MPPRIMHVITAAFKDVFTQNTLSNGFMEIPIVEYQALQDRMDAMQSSLDEHAEKEMAALACTSVQDAKLLREAYNSQWFTNSNYSVDTLQKLRFGSFGAD